MKPWIAGLLAATLLLGTAVARADSEASSRGARPGVPWQQLSPEQRQVLAPYRERWNQLPPGRQQAIARGAERWQQMTPEQREQMHERWRDATPQDREQAREKWHDATPEQRDKMREHGNQKQKQKGKKHD